MHKIARRLTDAFIETMHQYEQQNLLDPHAVYLHSTAAATSDLPAPEADGRVRMKNVWGRGLAQIFASVSPEMHDEFDIQYAKEALAPFGLVYYGCCEPLDRKVDILRQIPNLRKISITPWADIDLAAETIGRDYVLSVKPNPAILASKNLDEQALRRELGRIQSACRRYGCSYELVLKDISNIGGNPANLDTWARIAMEYARG